MFNVFVIDLSDNSVCDRFETVEEARREYPEPEFDIRVWSDEETLARDQAFAVEYPHLPQVQSVG